MPPEVREFVFEALIHSTGHDEQMPLTPTGGEG